MQRHVDEELGDLQQQCALMTALQSASDSLQCCRWHSLPLNTEQARLALVWRCSGQQGGAEAPVYLPGSCVRDLPLGLGLLGRVLITSIKVPALHLMALVVVLLCQ